MPNDPTHAEESATVQVTPAPPVPGPADPPEGQPALAGDPTPDQDPDPESQEKKNPVSNAIDKAKSAMTRLSALLSVFALLAVVACTPSTPSVNSTSDQAPRHDDTAASNDDTAYIQQSDRPDYVPEGVPWFHVGNPIDEATHYRVHVVVAKCGGEAAFCDPSASYEIVTADNNLLMTAGATQLWNCLSGGTCTTTLSTTNTQLAVGDSNTAASAAQTDLQATAGTKINAADASSCTNATPIVCSGTFSPVAAAGQVYQFSGFSGAGAAAINNTFEATATSNGSTITLLNSAGSGAITVTGGLIKPINYYRQQANASGSAVVSTNQITYVSTFGTSNANFAWNEWAVTTGAAATNKQSQAPPLMLNRAVPGGGLGTKTSAASWTLTVVLSLS